MEFEREPAQGYSPGGAETTTRALVRKPRHASAPNEAISGVDAEMAPATGREELAAGFSFSQTRKIVADLFQPKPWVYWTDFLLTWVVGLAAFRILREFPLFSPMQILLFVVSSLCFYRAGIFTHELVHVPSGKLKAFRVVWNLLIGIPFLIPSFAYYTHIDHHRRRQYGTKEDGEYLPLGVSSPWGIFIYLTQILFVPILAVIRFGLLTPLTWFSPRLRDLIQRHASSLVIDPTYIRPLPSPQALRLIRLQELACFLFIVGLSIGFYLGRPVPFVLPQAYLTSVFILTLNSLRTLGAHRYLSHGQEMTFVEQLLDSVNYSDRSMLAPLWAPVGLKYHALHHLFPTMPYHSMRQAHRRLMRELPADSAYCRTECHSLPAALRQLWRASCAAAAKENSATRNMA